GVALVSVAAQHTANLRPACTDNTDVWVVMAAYNEEARLGSTLQGLLDQFPNVVVVDDGSRDRTADVAKSYPVWFLRHLINCGQGAALQTGIDFALRK